jgi:hypothetical protein
MNVWIHSTILATSFAATIAVGIASAAIYDGFDQPVAAKADRLPVAAETSVQYTTVETRSDGMSVLERVPVGPLTN